MKNKIILLKLMADETRFKILEYLLTGEKCVCEIFPYVKRTQSTVSIHLNNLVKEGLLSSRKEGQRVFYFIEDKRVLKILKILNK